MKKNCLKSLLTIILLFSISSCDQTSNDVASEEFILPEIVEEVKQGMFTFIDQSVSIEDYSQNEVLEIPRSYIHNGKEIIVEHVEAISSYASKIIVSDTIKSFNAENLELEKVKEFKVNNNNPYFTSKNGIIYSKDQKEIVRFPIAKEYDASCLDNVEIIGDYAFNKVKLDGKNIVLPDTIKTIGDYAFYCSHAIDISLSNNLESIGKFAFYYNSFKSLEFPNSLKSIDENAFDQSLGLKSVYIGKNVEKIGLYSFINSPHLSTFIIDNDNNYYCSVDNVLYSKDKKSLYFYPYGVGFDEYLVIPECERIVNFSYNHVSSIDMSNSNVKEICDDAFRYSDSLDYVTFSNCLERIGDHAFYNNDISDIDLPESLLYIGESAFAKNELKEVVISKNVVTLKDYCFDSNDITSLYISENVSEIGANIVKNNPNLSSIEVDPNNQYYHMNEQVLYSKDNKKLVLFPLYNTDSSYTVLNGCEEIYSEAFWKINTLTSVKLPESLLSIGNEAFYQCYNLESMVIPSNVNKLGKGIFKGCDNLKSISLPTNIDEIPDSMFSNCVILDNVVIPEGVKVIGNSAFGACLKLSNLTLPSTLKHIKSGAFFSCNKLYSIDLPKGLLIIESNAFLCGVKSITIPSTVVYIGNFVFDEIKEIIVSKDNLYYSSIDGNLYNKDCSTLLCYASGKEDSKFVIPSSVTRVKEDVFRFSENLKELYVPDNVIFFEYQKFSIYEIDIYLQNSEIPSTWGGFSYGATIHYNYDFSNLNN